MEKKMYKTPHTEQTEMLPMHRILGSSGDIGINPITPADIYHLHGGD